MSRKGGLKNLLFHAPRNLFTKVYMKVTSRYSQILTGTFPFSRNSCELTYISCKKYWDLREVSQVRVSVFIDSNIGKTVLWPSGPLRSGLPWGGAGDVHWLGPLQGQQQRWVKREKDTFEIQHLSPSPERDKSAIFLYRCAYYWSWRLCSGVMLLKYRLSNCLIKIPVSLGYCHHDFFRCCKAARSSGLAVNQVRACCQARWVSNIFN